MIKLRDRVIDSADNTYDDDVNAVLSIITNINFVKQITSNHVSRIRELLEDKYSREEISNALDISLDEYAYKYSTEGIRQYAEKVFRMLGGICYNQKMRKEYPAFHKIKLIAVCVYNRYREGKREEIERIVRHAACVYAESAQLYDIHANSVSLEDWTRKMRIYIQELEEELSKSA